MPVSFALAILAAAAISPAQGALILNTPAGLKVGDTLRFMFVTAATTTATSTDISSYDTFVRNDVSTRYGTVTFSIWRRRKRA